MNDFDSPQTSTGARTSGTVDGSPNLLPFRTVDGAAPCDFHVVGIGASAGGLEALENLFRDMPIDTGMAFVIVQHLSPDFESHMDQLLSRVTDIPVQKVTNGVTIEPDQIYLIPPGKEMIVSGGKLLLADKQGQRGLSHPIDHFLRSLAQDAGRYSVGVILSGTGTDGSRGVVDVKKAGGLVICQSEDSARFNGMPLSAQDTGAVDLILPPGNIPEALTRYVSDNLGPNVLAQQQLPAKHDAALDALFALLRESHGIDFSQYKPNTIMRRLNRRLQANDVNDTLKYVEIARDHPEELNTLYFDLLIGVTQFFRDQSAFDFLANSVIPELIDDAESAEPIRVWVPGCASGEEAYSLAILLLEEFRARGKTPNFKIFATDVHQISLDTASIGEYHGESLAGVSDEIRDRYFDETIGHYRIKPDVRKHLVFARHNAIADAPFTKIDLISCRNLLIYFQPIAQRKALTLFHFGLKLGGFLVLGPSETNEHLAEEFVTIDKKWRVYRKRRDIRLGNTHTRLIEANGHNRLFTRTSNLSETPPTGAISSKLMAATYDRLLDRYMPAGFLVDDDCSLLHCFGGAESHLRVNAGRPSRSLIGLLPDELRTFVSGALQQCRKEHRPVKYTGIAIRRGESSASIDLTIEPLQQTRTSEPLYFVKVTTRGDGNSEHAPVEIPASLPEATTERIRNLENELRMARENLQATIEELETSNEELQAANEELIASNEEMQSTNEELHSVNEELYTVNAENTKRIAELKQLTDDMENLLTNTDVGVVFLDREMKIRKFTPKIGELFNLMSSDVGRKITSFSHGFTDDRLFDEISSVVKTQEQKQIEREIQDKNGRTYLLRMVPYMTAFGVDGVVMTLVDISSLKRAEQKLRRMVAIVESSDDAIMSTDVDGMIQTWNRGASNLYQYTSEEAIGRNIKMIVPPELRPELEELQQQLLSGEHIDHFETQRVKKDGSVFRVSLRNSPIIDDQGNVIGISAIDRDFTEQHEVAFRLEEACRRADEASATKSAFLAHMSHEIRTPIASILGLVELLDDETLHTDEARQFLETIHKSGVYLLSLVNDILDLSKVESGKLELRLARFDLTDLLDELNHLFEQKMKEKGLSFSIHSNGRIPVEIVSDSKRIRQVLVNLLSNAFKFTREGFVRVGVGFDAQNRILNFDVADSGPGIPSDQVDELFQPFTQLSDPNVASTGTGLGLAITKRLVDTLEGAIFVDQQIPHGTRFNVSIPIEINDGTARVEYQADTRPKSGESSRLISLENESKLTDKKILLVEDTPAMQLVMRRFLDAAGAKVTMAANAEQALERVAETLDENAEPFDAVLLDMMLPDHPGYEVAREIRSRDSELPIIAITANAMLEDRRKCFEAGCTEYLSKPIDRNQLIELLVKATKTAPN